MQLSGKAKILLEYHSGTWSDCDEPGLDQDLSSSKPNDWICSLLRSPCIFHSLANKENIYPIVPKFQLKIRIVKCMTKLVISSGSSSHVIWKNHFSFRLISFHCRLITLTWLDQIVMHSVYLRRLYQNVLMYSSNWPFAWMGKPERVEMAEDAHADFDQKPGITFYCSC